MSGVLTIFTTSSARVRALLSPFRLLLGLVALSACDNASAPDCMNDATKYQVIEKLGLPLAMGWDAPRADWRDAITADGTTIQEANGSLFLGFTDAKEMGMHSLSLVNVRTTSKDEQLGSWKCAALLVSKGPGGRSTDSASLPLTYTSELADGDKSHYVAATVDRGYDSTR